MSGRNSPKLTADAGAFSILSGCARQTGIPRPGFEQLDRAAAGRALKLQGIASPRVIDSIQLPRTVSQSRQLQGRNRGNIAGVLKRASEGIAA